MEYGLIQASVLVTVGKLFPFSISSVGSVFNQKINADNITRILDRLLEGYDNRHRPGSGGVVSKYWLCHNGVQLSGKGQYLLIALF